MSYPKQPKDIAPERAALAPYNFVEIPDQIARVQPNSIPDQDRYFSKRHTGEIICELTTASPMYIRGALTPQDYAIGKEAKNQPDFFFVDDAGKPVIPGSSLRGMLRSLLEIVSYSKIQAVSREQLIYRAVGDTTQHGLRYRERLMREDDRERHYYSPLMIGGYMKKKGLEWQIQPACELGGTTWARIREDNKLFKKLNHWNKCKNAFEIYVSVGPAQYQEVRGGFIKNKYAKVTRTSAVPEQGLIKMALAVSGWMPNKRTEAVIYPEDQNALPLDIDEYLVEVYREQISPEQVDLLGGDGVLRDGQPVFYLVDPKNPKKVAFFGHCMMFRLPYLRSPFDYIPAELRDEADIDLAEAIFGYTKKLSGKKDPENPKEKAYAGRVSFSDAALAPDQTDIWLDPKNPLIPKILASPKPTTFQHYLVQNEPNPFPTGGRFKDGRPRTELRLADYAAPTPGGTVIRGHKLYWHKGAVKSQDLAETKEVKQDDTQHTRIKPVKAGVHFSFKISFENLSLVELGALLWILDIASEEQYRLKLGMGKPLGMGAVGIKYTLNLSNRQERYKKLFEGNGWAEGAEDSAGPQTRARTEFERFVLGQLGINTGGNLADQPRIKQLLALLSWPGPDPSKTRYLEIERVENGRKQNEYKERPVLPDPLKVLGEKTSTLPTKPAQPILSETTSAVPAGYKRGKVKDFGLGPRQSFGFIIPDEGGADVFVHKNGLASEVPYLIPGQKVIFRIEKGMKGPTAVDVKVID